MKLRNISLYAIIYLITNEIKLVEGTKFDVVGPVVTLTLKDPSNNDKISVETKETSSFPSLDGLFSIPGLQPSITWSISSEEDNDPFPNMLPSLKSISLSTQYKYHEYKKFLYKAEGLLRFVTSSKKRGDIYELNDDNDDVSSEIIVKPSYSFKSKKACLNIKCGNEGVFGIMKLSACKGKRLIEYIKGSYKTSLPFINSVSQLTFQPSFDFIKGMPSCVISGIASGFRQSEDGKTTAIIDLNFDNPTLTFMHNLDERNTISPTISLNTAKIIYDWKLDLDHGSSIVTRVDPSSAIHVCWTDSTMNGHWITDFHLPLAANDVVGVKGPLVADIRVRRQFVF